MTRPVVFIGDSLTEYFDWQGRFPGREVRNLGIGGETVEGLFNRLDRVILGIQNPACIFIMTGINNIAMDDYNIAGTYKQILNKLFSVYGKTTLVVQSILPVKLPWVDNGEIRKLNGSLRELAKNFMAEYLDLYGLFSDEKGEPVDAYLLDDGVHLSDRGYEVWAKAAEEFLKTLPPA
ncbi:MAG TPA: GDSL-type esterase/lipase family protein [Dissulfurispiraceae bacterium]